jgi:hypothetical protein
MKNQEQHPWQTAHLKFLEDMEQIVQEKLDRLAFETMHWEEERRLINERLSETNKPEREI